MSNRKLVTVCALPLLGATSGTIPAKGVEMPEQTAESAARVCDYLGGQASAINALEDTRMGSIRVTLDCDAKVYRSTYYLTKFEVDHPVAKGAFADMEATIKADVCSKGWEPAFDFGWKIVVETYYEGNLSRPPFTISGC